MYFSIGCNHSSLSPFLLSFLTPAAEKSPEILFCRLNIIVTRPFPIQFSRSQQLCADSSHRVCKHPASLYFSLFTEQNADVFLATKTFRSLEGIVATFHLHPTQRDELQMNSLTYSQVPSSITHSYFQLNTLPSDFSTNS